VALLTCGFEGGTLGATIGTSGGDASPPFSTVSGASWTYSDTHTNRGSRAALLASAASGTHRLNWANGTSAALLRAYVWVSGAATGDTWLLASNPTGSNGVRALIQGTARLRLTDNGGTIRWTATNTFPTGEWVRVESYATAGTTTTDGTARLAYYLGDSTTAVEDSGLVTGVNTAAATGLFEQARFGGAGSAGDVWYDDIAVKTGSDAAWGAWPAITLTPPTVVVTGGSTLYLRRDFTGSTPVSPDTSVSHAAVRLSGPDAGAVIETADGIFYLPAPTSGATVYRETTTAAPSGLTTTTDITVSAPGGVATGVIRKTYDGTSLRG
jgi:hypothetical protein